MPFPFVRVSGSPYEMGCQHGRAAESRIRAFLDYLVHTSGRTRGEVLRAAERFRPYFERYCPRLLEEVRGLAEGAGLTPSEALLPQVRGEVLPLFAEGCTTFAVRGDRTADGHPLLGQTSDMEPELEAFFLVLHLTPADGPRLLTWTFAGQLGYHGLNEHGVAHFANSLGGGPVVAERPGGLPHYPVKRRLYECHSREEILAMWAGLPVCSSGNYMLSAGGGDLFDLEITPAGAALLEDEGRGFLVHTNHFLSLRFRTAETDAAAWPDSFPRLDRMTELLGEQLGRLDVARLKELLADHQNAPTSICRHEEAPRRITTVSGLIAEPAAGRLHVSCGSPCRGDWSTYEL